VCYNNYPDHIYRTEYYADLHCCRTVLRRCFNTCSADYFKQWHQWYLESCYQQLSYHHLHLYSDGWSVRYDNHSDHNYRTEYYADLHSCRTVLLRCFNTCSADYFEQWYHWYLESCYKQCCNNDIHLHSGCWSVRYDNYPDHSHRTEHYSCLRCNRTGLPGYHYDCSPDYFE
jgi:hypothetical protein